MNLLEQQYIRIIKNILKDGIDRSDRTGLGSRAIFGASLKINLSDGFPIITHRKVSLRIAFEEIMWMLRGSVNANELKDKNIHIWDGNTTRDFLDKRKLYDLPEGHIGKGYGFQWRNYNGDYEENNVYELDHNGVDQIKNLIEGLKSNPNDRRHIVLGWNPAQLNEMALPPCHLYNQYQILNGTLNSSFVMRSWDFLYGAPYNIMGYALLNHIIAKHLGLIPGTFYCVGMDVHIYENQLDMANEILYREHYELPQLLINKELQKFDDLFALEYKDLKLENYKSSPDIANKPSMAV